MTQAISVAATDGPITQNVFNDDGPTGNHFLGTDARIAGNWAVGSSGFASGFTGEARVYKRETAGWTLKQTLTASDGGPGQLFGFSVHIDRAAETIIVGALADKAYIFTRSGDTWMEQAILTGSDAAGTDFGVLVHVEADIALVSTQDKDKLYIFEKGAGWATGTETQAIVGSDTVGGDRFGMGACTDGTVIVTGAYWKNTKAGAIYVFTKSGTWGEVAKKTASDAASNFEYGVAMEIVDNEVIVGSSQRGLGAGGSVGVGKAYVLDVSTPASPVETDIIIPGPNAGMDDGIGGKVDISGSRIVMRSKHHNGDQGAVFLARKFGDSWGADGKILGDPQDTDDVIDGVGVSGDYIIAGSPQRDDGANDKAGRIYIWEEVVVSGISVSII